MTDGFTPVDGLTQFCDWWLGARPLCPPLDFYSRVAGNMGTALYRQGQFQVQLFVCDPGTEIADHLHPNVDSYEVYVAGEVCFRRGGETLLTLEQIAELGPEKLLGLRVRVAPDEWHGATIGPRGGAFLSVQHWLNGKQPTSVHLDWDGPVLDAAHAEHLAALAAERSGG